MATRKRTVTRRSTIDLQPTVKDYLLNRSMRERSAHFEGTLKAQLMTALEEGGVKDGTTWSLPLDEPLTFVEYKSGKPKEKMISGVERRERKSTTMDQDKAMALLKKKKLVEECTSTITVINEDAVLAANYGGKITDKELAAIYSDSTTYAFYLTEE
jgi:hypothetical protein